MTATNTCMLLQFMKHDEDVVRYMLLAYTTIGTIIEILHCIAIASIRVVRTFYGGNVDGPSAASTLP